MARIDSPTTRAYWQLAELAREEGLGDPQLFALTWLAAARMVVMGAVGTIQSVDMLAEQQAWNKLLEFGLPTEAYERVVSSRAYSTAQALSRHANAATIVSELAKELGINRWDVLPCLTETGNRRSEGLVTVVPELAELLMDMVEAPPESEVWIPFDPSGQLTVEALRRGWRVLASSPMQGWPLVRQLLLAIETGYPSPESVRNEVERDAAGRPITRASYALVVPPFGMSVKDGRMAMWDITEARGYEQYARSEAWALFEFANRVDTRAVFLTPEGVLFAKGQEQRLREYLLMNGGVKTKVQAVVSLPSGVFSFSQIAGAIVVLSSSAKDGQIYVADLGSGRRSTLEAGQTVFTGREIALGRIEEGKSRYVSLGELQENENSFAPSRYLRRLAELTDDTIKLGEICTIIRPPAVTRESTPIEVLEVGLPDLHQWKPISGELDKRVCLKSQPKDGVLLRADDIVLSVKGSVGRAALVGDAAEKQSLIVSQSCVALRLKDEEGLSYWPEVLLMYLRSPHGQAQLSSLQVGTGVQHISPGTLMSAFSVPFPVPETSQEIRQDFRRLVDLEHQMAGIQHSMTEIAWGRWPEMAL